MNKIEEILEKIKELEAEIATVKDELHIVENEEKIAYHKINIAEVKKDQLCQSIEFYKNKAKKMRNTLSRRLALCSKFSMADKCYDKLLNTYKENYLQADKTPPLCNETLSNSTNEPDFKKSIQTSHDQLEKLKESIDENSSILRSLMQELEYPAV